MNHRLHAILIAAVALSACADVGGADISDKRGNDGFANNGGNNGSSNNGFVPEVEDEFTFAQPAVLGTDVYVANKTLNSVAVIDSRTLSIRTAPVGFSPTEVVGPTAAAEDARLFVLNEGSSTVSVITPGSLAVSSVSVLRRANRIAASPDGTWALAWYTAEDDGQPAGDLSAASLIKSDGSVFQLAVGFRVERVEFSTDSQRALVLTDDGVSAVDIAAITGDALVPPVALLPLELQAFDRSDREVVLDPAGDWAVARVSTFAGVVLTELATQEQWTVQLPTLPTDLDWVDGATPRLLGMLSASQLGFVATVPDGLIALSESQPDIVITEPDMGTDMGGTDMGSSDMGAGDMNSADMGADMATDLGGADGGVDMASADMGVDAGPQEPFDFEPVEGFTFLPLAQPRLGAAEVASTGTTALLFSTLNAEKRAVLLDLESLEQRSIAFEKGVRGAVSDDVGATFVVLHTRDGDPVPDGTSPADPQFIAAAHGISIIDVASAATRLVLTDAKPEQATLWRGAEGARMFMIFEAGSSNDDAERDVLRVDLQSFSTETFRLASQPEGLGRVDDAGKVFVHQLHPQGRITFVDVETDRRQTVTGYQLNSGID